LRPKARLDSVNDWHRTAAAHRCSAHGLIADLGVDGRGDCSPRITAVVFVSEERLTQTIERPQAVCQITGLPTAAPTATKSTVKSSK